MKILWIVNTPIDILGEKLYGKRANGLWMDALLSDYRKHRGFDLVVATTAKVKNTVCFENDGVLFYALPDNVPLLYNEKRSSNQAAWDNLIRKEKPDLVQVWGTEFSHGLCALKAAKEQNIPSVIYMQGYLGSIAKNYLAGLTRNEIKKNITLRDVLKRDSILAQQKHYYNATERETEEFLLSGRIICENDWCEQNISEVAPDIKVYRCPLSISEAFSKKQWNLEGCQRHSIICNASGYPLKGLHMLLRAIALLKEEYPDIKLYVPGEKLYGKQSFIWRLRRNGYRKYIERLIKSLNLDNYIVWLGPLPQKELAAQYEKANVFVMCSAIENHSSSLKEAMMVGLPSVASAVGGIPEYVNHGNNGFLYDFKDYAAAAEYIKEIFEDDALAQKFSDAARKDMIELHENNNVFSRMLQIYGSILDER